MDQYQLEKFQVNADQRSIVFSICSDNPYQRYDEKKDIVYDEVLVISDQSVDMSRLNTGNAPILWNHDTDANIGIVEKAWILGNKVFIKCRFSKNDKLAQRVWNDMLDSILKNVSIGYEILDFTDVTKNGKNIRYVTKFLIYQVTVCSCAADPTVGLRSFNPINIKEKNMEPDEAKNLKLGELDGKEITIEPPKEEVKQQALPPVEEPPVEEDKPQDDLNELKAQVEALQEELKALKECGEDKEQIKACEEENEEKACDEVDEEVKAEINQIGADFNVPQEEIKSAIDKKLSVKEFKNIVKEKSFNINTKNKENKSMKHEFDTYLKERNFDKPFVMRDFTGFTDADLVGTQTTPLVPALDKRMGLKGYRALNGLHSNISIPVQSTRNTIYTPDINAASTDSNPAFTAVTLTPTKFTGSTLIAKEMLYNTNSDVEAFIIDSLLKEIAYKIENMMLEKVLAGATTKIGVSAITAVDWDDILAAEAAVDGYMLDSTSFVMTPAARAALKATPKATDAICGFICEGNEVNGYEARISGVAAKDAIYFGDWGQLVLGTWGEGIEILVDPFTESRAGNVVVVASALVDAAVIQPDAFCVIKVNESSSSSDSSASSSSSL